MESNFDHLLRCLYSDGAISRNRRNNQSETTVDALNTWQSRCSPQGWSMGRGATAPPQYGRLGAMPPEIFSKFNVEIAYFSAFFANWSDLSCSGVKAGLELKYITKIASIIEFDELDEILTRPHGCRSCRQPLTAHPICLLSKWAKRKCNFWCFAA